MKEELKKRLLEEIDVKASRLIEISRFIHQHPEPPFQEHQAMKILTEELLSAGFQVQKNVLGMETAFIATYQGKGDGPSIGFFAEYDALPMGHACGHNLIGTTAIGAGIGLSSLRDHLKGKIVIFGTPAEEAGGGKLPFCEKGLFSSLVDVAILVHPSDKTIVSGTSLAIDALEFTYLGRAAHAATSPHLGINALDGVIMLYNSINALRQQLKDDVRIHGIITQGGVAPNIIPEKAVARFYIRALKREYLDRVVDQVLSCAEGAAMATSSLLKYHNYEPSYDNLISNSLLADTFQSNLLNLGEEVSKPDGMMGSTDMGNVSHQVPSIHPHIAIGPQGIGGHTMEFLEAANSEEGHRGLLLGTKAAAMTAIDILTDPNLLVKIKKEFLSQKENY